MQLVSVWSDLYANALALYAGRAGGQRWLVATKLEHAAQASAALSRLEGKGETVLLIYRGLTPLEAALNEQSGPGLGRSIAGVLVIDQHLGSGPEVEIAPVKMQAHSGGLSYLEGGRYPAWQDALSQGGSRAGPQGECPPASVCAHLGILVRVCAPEALVVSLREWWAATPHTQIAGG